MFSRRILRSFLRDAAGATAVEFALVATVFFLTMSAIIEFGLYMWTEVSLESIVTMAGRSASVAQGGLYGCNAGDRVCIVTRQVRAQADGLVDTNLIKITAAPLNGTQSTVPYAGDTCLTTTPPTVGGPCPFMIGKPWYNDDNGNGKYDAGPANFSVGGPGQIVEIQVDYPWQILNPMISVFFSNGLAHINSRTIVRNEN